MEPLSTAMREDVGADGKPVWTPLAPRACSSSSPRAAVLEHGRRRAARDRRWSWPIVQSSTEHLAYVASLVLFQVGTRVLGP